MSCFRGQPRRSKALQCLHWPPVQRAYRSACCCLLHVCLCWAANSASATPYIESSSEDCVFVHSRAIVIIFSTAKWMFCEIVLGHARAKCSGCKGHSCSRSGQRELSHTSLRLLLVAQLRPERIHIFRHEARARRLRRASLQVPPRSLRAFVFHRIRSRHGACVSHSIRSRRINLGCPTLKDLGLFAENGAVLLASFRAPELCLELIVEVFAETRRSIWSVDVRSAGLFTR